MPAARSGIFFLTSSSAAAETPHTAARTYSITLSSFLVFPRTPRPKRKGGAE